MDNCWIYEGKCLEEPPEGYYGFIYCITEKSTGKKYWGKKALVHNFKKTISKKARIASDNPKKRIERTTKDSGWKDYFGSCKPLLAYIEEIGEDKFTREIIKFYPDKQNLAYGELVLLIENKVLFREDCWNKNVLAKFFAGKIYE